jgi:iron complex outermembrane receptor protein
MYGADKNKGAGVALALLVTFAGIAQGQTPQLEEVVVTAERKVSDLQATPVAVSAFSADALEKLQVTQTLDLADNVPNLVLYTGVANPGMVNLYMRGAGEQIGGLVTSESAVGIYVDDVYNARLSAANFDLVDIERIEVLRGPQGTLYGRNSMTGAIKIVTRQADGEAWAKGSLAYGSFDEVTIRAGGGFSLIEDTLAATVSAQYRDRGEGWLDNRATGGKRGTREVASLRGKLSYIGSDTFKATLGVYFSDDENDGLTPVATNSDTLQILTGDFRTVQSPSPSAGLTEQFGTTLDLEWTLGDNSLRSISAFIEVEDEFRFDLSGGVEVAPGQFAALIDRNSVASSWQLSQEFQWSGLAMDGRLDYIVGAYLFKEHADQQIDDLIFFVPLLPTIIDQVSESTAAFVQGNYRLTPTLGLTLGVRWTRDEKNLQGQIDTFFGSGIPSAVNRDDSWSVTTPRLGLEYEYSDNVFLYGSISRGYRTGGYNGLTVANPVSFNTPFDPETVWAYEVGAKTELLDRRLRLNTAVFFNQIEDVQQSSTLGGGATAIQNVGDVDVSGLEIEVTALVSDGLEVFGHATLQDEKYQDLNPGSVAALQGQGRLSHLSKDQYQLGFNYEYSMSTGGTLLLGGSWSHRSPYFSDAANQPINDSGTIDLLNAFVGYESPTGRWRTTLSGRNLADEEYSKIGLVLAVPNGIRFVNEPPTWQLQFTMNGL